MHRIARVAASLSLAVLFIWASPIPGVAQQTPAPEHQRLGLWVGEWTYVLGDGSGTMEFEWLGDFFIRGNEVTPAGWNVLHVMGYDAEEGVYTWARYWSSGYSDAAKGWFQDDTWTFVFTEPAGNIRRMTMAFESENEIAFKWERSVNGGAWEPSGEGRTTKIR